MTIQENIPVDQNEPFDGIKENRETKPPVYFNILYYGLIAWGLVFIAYFLLSGWSSHQEFKDKMEVHQQQVLQSMQGRK
ncbi:MAG TPA: hypothetical protein ENI88_04760 [Desulfobulbus sp.]|nr:hypothetical protein [Desulfobulbus sp.]